MSTRFADDFSTPPLPETDLRKVAGEVLRRALEWLAPPPEPDVSNAAPENLDEYDVLAYDPATVLRSILRIDPENDGLILMRTDLAELYQRDDYDEDVIKPTPVAFVKTWELLDDAGAALGGKVPLGTVYPFGNGGLRIEWISPEKELRLSISPAADGQSYIYYERGDLYATDYNVSANNLANWLRWFKDNGRGER